MAVSKLPISPKAAKEIGSKFYFTGVPCKRGHISPRQASDAGCVECKRERGRKNTEYHKAYYNKNRERVIQKSAERYRVQSEENAKFNKERYAATREAHKRYRELNRGTRNAQIRENYRENRESRLAYAAEYRSRTVEQRKKYSKVRYPKRRDYYFAQAAKRRAAKDQRTPNWLTHEHKAAILRVYSERARLTKETGVVHHVDHIVPLRGKNVSGLHVPWNLQVLTAKENLSKSNKFLEVA